MKSDITKDLKKLEFTIISAFDIGILKKEDFNSTGFTESFRNTAKGAYIVSEGYMLPWKESEIKYLKYYKELYDNRIKKQFRKFRESIIFELEEIPCKGLRYNNETLIIGDNERFNIHVIFAINKIGIGILFMLFEIPPRNIIEQSRKLRDTENLYTEINLPFYNAEISISNLIRLYQSLLLSIIHSDKDTEQNKDKFRIILHDNEDNISSFYDFICEKISKDAVIYKKIEEYPTFFIETKINKDNLQDWKINNADVLRAIVTGDKNWYRKKNEIVQTQVIKGDQSSADSVVWIIDDDGTMKLYSSDFETDIEKSKIMALFELEILLTLKYFLHRINFYLTEATISNWSIISIADFKDKTITDLDTYFNINISHKDTTRKRIEKCKEILHINYLHNIAIAKFDSLSSRLNSLYQSEIIRRELLLIIFFGIFSVGTLAFSIFSWIYNPEKILIVIIGTLTPMIILAIIIILYIHKRSIGGA